MLSQEEISKLSDVQYITYKNIAKFTQGVKNSGIIYCSEQGKQGWFLISVNYPKSHIIWESKLDGRAVNAMIRKGILTLNKHSFPKQYQIYQIK